MTWHSVLDRRALAASLWLASFAWLAWGPYAPGVHRTIIGAAITATIAVLIDSRALDVSEVIRLAAAAGRAQSDAERLSDR